MRIVFFMGTRKLYIGMALLDHCTNKCTDQNLYLLDKILDLQIRHVVISKFLYLFSGRFRTLNLCGNSEAVACIFFIFFGGYSLDGLDITTPTPSGVP